MDHVEFLFVKMSSDAVTPTRATEIKVLLTNTAPCAHSIVRGDPIAQLILEKVSLPILERVKELPTTTRGEQGCGS